jgi:tRNA threonylcarbamoyladenosine biosynthesis protein TsaB
MSARAPSAPVLAIESSGPSARVALVSADGQVVAAGERVGPRHSATLLPLCDDLLSSRGLTVASLAGIACGRGPGSFTGLRVGLAVAKGLALAHDLPVVLVSSLEALAHDLFQDLMNDRGGGRLPAAALLAPCIDAGKGEVHGQLYRLDHGSDHGSNDGRALTAASEELRLLPGDYADQVRAAAAGAPIRIAGTGVDRHADLLIAALGPAVRVALPAPGAAAVARLALPRLARGDHDDLDSATPSYGRPPDITIPKPRP